MIIRKVESFQTCLDLKFPNKSVFFAFLKMIILTLLYKRIEDDQDNKRKNGYWIILENYEYNRLCLYTVDFLPGKTSKSIILFLVN